MKSQLYFSHFCSVQHRLNVSPAAAALFFYLLGEISSDGIETNHVALANSRIGGTIHITQTALRKARLELVDAGIISFLSADNGRTPALYTLLEIDNWKLDAVKIPSAPKIEVEHATNENVVEPIETSTEISNPEPEPSHAPTNADVIMSAPEVRPATAQSKTPKEKRSHLPYSTPHSIPKHQLTHQQQKKLESASAALSRHGKHKIKFSYQPRRGGRTPKSIYKKK